ncbi:MAG: 3-dehydroquinate synthase, partial [Atribacterota bacterium]
MRDFLVRVENKAYPVIVCSSLFSSHEWLEQIQFPSRKGVIITNTTVGPLYAEKVKKLFAEEKFDLSVVVVPDGEEYKELATAAEIYHELLRVECDRTSFLIALGGGVITDITGFVASTYMRGIPYFQFPTRLLAQVDSSIGGKTGVNLSEGKNLVGTFYQPEGVFIGLDFLETLPEREYVEGWSEIAKAAFLRGGDFLALLSPNVHSILARDPVILEELVFRSVRFKKGIVEEDEKEKGIRGILNYGHTLGHALEKTSGYGVLRHGEAISVEMMGAILIAEKMGYVSGDTVEMQKEILEKLALPVTVRYALDREQLVQTLL